MEVGSSSGRWGSHQSLKWFTCGVKETKPKRIRHRRDRAKDGGGANASESSITTGLSSVVDSKSLNTQKLGKKDFFPLDLRVPGWWIPLPDVFDSSRGATRPHVRAAANASSCRG